ncbi:Helix-turn-helix domain containing protein, protein [Aphelenchoides bicaudatus]|nr:Helix-turn-helix domain containing protein, protein [Aphelenchoides bicaudatus]
MNSFNSLPNLSTVQPTSDCESPPTRSSSTDNSTTSNNLQLPAPTQSFPGMPLTFDLNQINMMFNFMQMMQRFGQPTNPFENTIPASLSSIWQPVHPPSLVSQQQLQIEKPADVQQQQSNLNQLNEANESALETDYLENLRPNQLSKRQYTDSTLNIAISQIRNRVMGTRRASAKYGIPRSTLRNKMNKSREIPLIEQQQAQLFEPKEEEEVQIESKLENQILPPVQNEPPTAEQQPPITNLNLWLQFVNSIQNGMPPAFPFQMQQFSGLIDQQQEQKPARGKRGQYRRYDKGALQKAVEEVRAGMSVHRAGTLYGVPHSTLEYKVKDRSRKGQQQRLEAELKKQAEMAQQIDADIDCCPKLSPVNSNSPANTPSSSSNFQ